MDVTGGSILKSDWLCSLQLKMEKLYTVNKTRPGAALGSGHELLIAKFILKLKKEGKTTMLFRYDLNQIPYDYTVEVTNRFKGLNLIDKVPENYGQRLITLYKRQWSKPSPDYEMQNGKIVVWGSLTNSWEKKRHKSQRRKGKDVSIWMESSKE